MKDVCPSCSKETSAFALLKEILAAHKAGEIGELSTKKRGQYIIDIYKECLSATKGAATSMPDIQNFK